MPETPTPGQGTYRWHVQSLFAARASIDQIAERYLNGLAKEGWEIMTVAPREGSLLIVARKKEPAHA